MVEHILAQGFEDKQRELLVFFLVMDLDICTKKYNFESIIHSKT